MSSDTSSRVLHDVAVQGRVVLGRFRSGGPAGVPNAATAGATTPRAQSTGQAEPKPAAVQPEDEARRRGYEEGFAKGCLEGRTKGVEEARELAARVAEQSERDRAVRHEQLVQTLRQEAQAASEARLAQLNGLIAALPAQIEARLQAAEDDMLVLCFEVVCRQLGESATRPDVLEAYLRQAMQALRNRPLVAIHLHPEDLAMLEKAGVVAANACGDAVRWIASTEIALGGCVLETPEGGLDARFETQLQALREALQNGRAAARASDPARQGAGD